MLLDNPLEIPTHCYENSFPLSILSNNFGYFDILQFLGRQNIIQKQLAINIKNAIVIQ